MNEKEIDRLIEIEAFGTLAELARQLLQERNECLEALRGLLTVSLPRDVSGSRIVDRAYAVVKSVSESIP